MLRHLIALAIAALLGACADRATVRIDTGFVPPGPASLAGELILPKGNGPHPAVVVAHGCSGITVSQRGWAETIAGWGYATLLLNSFATRGIASVCVEYQLLTGNVRAPDIGAAARWLRARPDIDPDRIGMIGFSHGGWTALWTAHPSWPAITGAAPLRAVVAVYPYCDPLSGLDANAPLLVLIGDADDWTPAERCRWLQSSIGPRRDVEFVYYPGARHGYDVPGLNIVVQGTGPQGVTSRWLLGDPAATRDTERRVKAWFDLNLAARRQ